MKRNYKGRDLADPARHPNTQDEPLIFEKKRHDIFWSHCCSARSLNNILRGRRGRAEETQRNDDYQDNAHFCNSIQDVDYRRPRCQLVA